LIQPIDKFAVTATLVDQLGQAITAIAPAFLTGHAQHIELANEIAEDDCAVAGHQRSRPAMKINPQYPDNDCGCYDQEESRQDDQ
jgi:hypothetical protein